MITAFSSEILAEPPRGHSSVFSLRRGPCFPAALSPARGGPCPPGRSSSWGRSWRRSPRHGSAG